MPKFIQYLLILLTLFLRPDVQSGAAPDSGRIVTSIQVSVYHGGTVREYVYTDSSHMTQILNYLRLLDPQSSIDIDPDSFRSDFYRITLHYNDGSSTVYRQIAMDYLQKNGGNWQRLVPDGDLQFPVS